MRTGKWLKGGKHFRVYIHGVVLKYKDFRLVSVIDNGREESSLNWWTNINLHQEFTIHKPYGFQLMRLSCILCKKAHITKTNSTQRAFLY